MTAGVPTAMMGCAMPLAPARRRTTPMCTPDPAFYPLLARLLVPLTGVVHAASLTALTDLVWAVLLAQALHPADLVRALPALATAQARQGFRRVRRGLERAGLTSHVLTPRLVPVVLGLVADGEVLLVLDSSRCGRWEVFTLGVRLGGRVLPVAWQVLPYPWPKGQFTPTVLTLLDRTLACWPPDRPVHLVADRGFPSKALVRRLHEWRRRLRLGYTLRLKIGEWVQSPDERLVPVAALVGNPTAGRWRSWAASYPGCADAQTPTRLVAGRALAVWPRHQAGPADQARRQARAAARAAHLRSKGQARAVATDTVWCLLTTDATWRAAVTHYDGRFSTEGTYRDLKSWDWEEVVNRQREAALVEGLTGLAVLSYLVQVGIGVAADRTQEPGARARQRQWTTTDRLSGFSRGRLVLHDHAHDWRPWLRPALTDLLQTLGAGPGSRVRPQPARRSVRPPTVPHQEAA